MVADLLKTEIATHVSDSKDMTWQSLIWSEKVMSLWEARTWLFSKTHTEGGIDETEADASEVDAQKEVSSPEVVVEKEIVWFYTYHKVSIEENGLECIDS